MRAVPLAALALCLALSGCAGAGRYTSARVGDLADAVPVSVAYGWGVSASLRATPLLHLGLGLTPVVSHRAGWEDRVFRGHWKEYQATVPWVFFLSDISSVPPRPHEARGSFLEEGLVLVYRWQVDRDAPGGEGALGANWEPQVRNWGRHPPRSREIGGAFLIPEWRRELNWHDLRQGQGNVDPLSAIGSPMTATLWEVSRDGPAVSRAWDLFEGDLFLAVVGLRVGLRPVEFVDFLTGLAGFDLLGDDLQPATATELPRIE